MIEYIVKKQNNYYYAHLFLNNLVSLLKKEIQLTILFRSEIFNYCFDYDEWPASHKNTDKKLAPFNDSLFRIRDSYKKVFKKLYDDYIKENPVAEKDSDSFKKAPN